MRKTHFVFLSCTLVLFLLLRFFLFYLPPKEEKVGQITFTTPVLSAPRMRQNKQIFVVSLPEESFLSRPQYVRVTTSLYPKISYADTIEISGKLVSSKTPSSRQEDKLLIARKIDSSIYFPKIRFVDRNGYLFLGFIRDLRKDIITFFESHLPPTLSSLALGITFGIHGSMSNVFFEKLRQTGVLHVIAASGMNITLFGGMVSSVLCLFLKRQIALVLSVCSIGVYAVLAGLEPSIVRASIMGGFLFLANILGRQYLALWGLCMTGWLMLFMSPELLSDIGFQLSFAATLGLITGYPLLVSISWIQPFIKKTIFFQDMATTIIAQVFTLPLLLIYFGSYSLTSILVNTLILWTVPFIMVFSGCAALLALFTPMAGMVLLYLALPLLFLFEVVVTVFAKESFLVSVPFAPAFVAAYYCFLFGGIFVYRAKKQDA